MNFNDLVNARYSCRNYNRNKIIDRKILEKIIETAQFAPSACNRQPWVFIVVDDQCEASCRKSILDSYNRPWIETAPAFIIACGNHNQAWIRPADGKDHTDVDLSIAIEHICLAATDAELGTCWVCNFDVDILTKGLNIPQGIEPIAIIPIGYPIDGSIIPQKNRKEIEDIIKWGKF